MKSYKARGIVLHTVRYGETSVILYLLTDTVGRQTYIVQGVRGGRSKTNKAALLQPMFLLDIVGLESAKMELHRIMEMRPSVLLSTIPFDIRKSTVALFMAEVVYRLVREAEPDSPLFGFVSGAVKALDAADEGLANFPIWFLAGLTPYLGFHPGNEYRQGFRFDIQEGLYVPYEPPHGMSLDGDNARLLDRLISASVEELPDIKLSRDKRSAFLTALISFFGYHLDAVNQIRSVQILREVF